MKSGQSSSVARFLKRKRLIVLILVILILCLFAIYIYQAGPTHPDLPTPQKPAPESLINTPPESQKQGAQQDEILPESKPSADKPLKQTYPKGLLQDAPSSNPWEEDQDMGC